MIRIESLLSARLFLAPQHVGNRMYFVSNMSGRLSLYAMDTNGSVPELLLPPDLALQNPELLDGIPFYIFPKLGKILLMLDHDGDENYQPMLIPITGGFPEPAFGDLLDKYRVACTYCDDDQNIAYFLAQSRTEQMTTSYRVNLETGDVLKLAQSTWGMAPAGPSHDHRQVALVENYTVGDSTLYLWQEGAGEPQVLYGVPLDKRADGQQVPLSAIRACSFATSQRGLLLFTGLFSDQYGLGYLDLAKPPEIKPVTVTGLTHQGNGELVSLDDLKTNNRYLLHYNIDGASWLYEATFDEQSLQMHVDAVICGEKPLANGVQEGGHYDKASDSFSLSCCTATAPTQLYVVSGKDRKTIKQLTHERVLGVPQEWLSPGEDASFVSYDGLRISARLYLPARALGFEGPRPLVYYVHGGPQSQERPNFAWFSMPLIQYLTLNGFAVFVPNVRGSSGYGLDYMKRVDRDWGGKDRMDHVHAMQCLAQDQRIDSKRAAVVGRSYGGYMTLTLAARHPELWSAACDMFGPYDLFTFMNRIPETWKPYFAIAVGDPVKDRDLLVERSPVTYIDQIVCPLLVIQGKNDPRVVEQESRDVVERLRATGKTVEYLMFENEGHDVTCFRYVPKGVKDADVEALNRQLLDIVQREGRVFLTSTQIEGKLVLRACIVNFRTTETDLDVLLEVLAEAGHRVLQKVI